MSRKRKFRPNKGNRGWCPKCQQYKILTRHHIIPKWVHPQGNGIIMICNECHIELHSILREAEKLVLLDHEYMYYSILKDFLGEEMRR